MKQERRLTSSSMSASVPTHWRKYWGQKCKANIFISFNPIKYQSMSTISNQKSLNSSRNSFTTGSFSIIQSMSFTSASKHHLLSRSETDITGISWFILIPFSKSTKSSFYCLANIAYASKCKKIMSLKLKESALLINKQSMLSALVA